ncbi:unnamed protein product, partial [Urochloa humidicola]
DLTHIPSSPQTPPPKILAQSISSSFVCSNPLLSSPPWCLSFQRSSSLYLSVVAMDHNNAGPRAACVTILITLLVFLLSAIAIIFRLDDRTAGALRAALACLIFIYMAYLLFEVKVLQLLLSLFHPAATYDPQPPMSFVGHFSPLGSSVGREPSPEEAAGGGPAPPPPAPSSEAGYMASDSEYVPEPAPFSGGGGCYHRRRGPSTRIH